MLDQLLDLLYPARCVSCAVDGDWWCNDCRKEVEAIPHQPCPRCLSVDVVHTTCDGILPFQHVVTTGFYHSPPLRLLIAAVKYDGLTAAAGSRDEYLRSHRRLFHSVIDDNAVLVPMPLSDGRFRERGFNQAMWIAEGLSRVTGVPIHRDSILIRRKGAAAQADLEHDAVLRAANVKGQFHAIGRMNHSVILVDDVVTTGSTAAEAARALLAAGAPQVSLVTLALGK